MRGTIATPRLRLGPYRAADAQEVFACITPPITRYLSWEPPNSADELAARLEARTRERNRTEQLFLIRCRASERCLGIGGVHHLGAEAPELGLWLRADAHGYGYGTEVVTALATWAFAQLGKERFTYPVAVDNRPSRRIAERLGGVETGRSTGVKYDAVIYEIPWRATRPGR